MDNQFFDQSINRRKFVCNLLNFDGSNFDVEETLELAKGTLLWDNCVLATIASGKTLYFGDLSNNLTLKHGEQAKFSYDGTIVDQNV